MEGFPKDIKSLILHKLPPFYQKVAKLVCKEWYGLIGKKSICITKDDMLKSIIRDDSNTLLKWIIMDLKLIDFTKHRFAILDRIFCKGAVKCLQWLIYTDLVNFDLYWFYDYFDHRSITNLLQILNYLHPLICQSIENRITTFFYCIGYFNAKINDNYNILMNWFASNVISENLLEIIANNGFNFDAKTCLRLSCISEIVIDLNYLFELSPKFIRTIQRELIKYKQHGWELELVQIIIATTIVDSSVCEIKCKPIHDQIQHICKCQIKPKLKKIKI